MFYVDDFLTDEALESIREFVLTSTFWIDNKNAYLGTYLRNGFGSPLLNQIQEELRQLFPKVFCDHALQQAWGYKYDEELLSGIKVHADEASVNVNFWITPDEANLDPSSGGLIVYHTTSSIGLNFEDYNVGKDIMHRIIEEHDYQNITVPYGYNRAVIFRSDMFHATDNFKFKKGYKNRRINLTLLFGEMYAGQIC